MGILDPTPLVDEPASNRWMGQGPMAAANGNIGGLQRALQRPGPVPASNPIMSVDMGPRLEEAMNARIRSPQDMQSAAEERRGALQRLQEAQRAPQDNYTWDTHYMEGMMNAPGYLDINSANQYGVANAMRASRENQEKRKKSEIDAAKTELEFLFGEEKGADAAETKALSDVTRTMIAQNKLANQSAVANRPGKHLLHTREGIFDTTQLDEQGAPKLVHKFSRDEAHVMDSILRRKNAAALELAKNGMFKTDGEMQQWVRDQASAEYQIIKNGPDAAANSAPQPVQPPPEPKPMNGLDPVVLKNAVKWAESNGNPNAVSPKGAVGPMQTMPATLADPGFGVTPASDNTPQEQERVGEDYLNSMVQRYGNVPTALAAYNWGPGNVDKWLKEGADPRKLPKETRQYIGDIMTQMQVAQNGGSQGGAPPSVDVGLSSAPPLAGALTPPAGGLPIKSRAEIAGEVELEKETSKNLGEEQGLIIREAETARNQLNAVESIMQKRDLFKPGAFSELKRQAGSYLGALGIDNKLTEEAADLTSVNKLLQQQINARMSQEKGVQARDDERRFRLAYAEITDPAAAFDFSLAHYKELSLRQIDRHDLMKREGIKKVSKDWDKYRQEKLGPVFVMDDNGLPMFRNEYIEWGLEDSLRKDPKQNPVTLRRKLEEDWLRWANPRKK